MNIKNINPGPFDGSLRDNLLLSWMHARLMAGFMRRLPRLLARRRARAG